MSTAHGRAGRRAAVQGGARRSGAATGDAVAAAVPVALVASAVATSLLARRARELTAALVETRPVRTSDLPDVVALVLVLLGAAVAGWYLLTALTGTCLMLGRRGGPAAVRLEMSLARWGAPALRRAFATTAVASMGLGVAVGTSAVAAPTDGPSVTVDAPAPPRDRSGPPPVPVDLGWGAPAVSEGPGEHLAAPTEAATTPAEATTTPAEAPSPPPEAAPTPTKAVSVPAGSHIPAGSRVPSEPAARSTGTTVAGPTPAPTGASAPAAPGPTGHTPATEPARSDEGAHLVRAGESLWSIAASHLGAGASDSEVAAAWPRWYRHNATTVGPDPNLIHPGQLLQAPTEEIP